MTRRKVKLNILEDKRGFIDLDEIDWVAFLLAFCGALLAWWYVGYLGTGFGFFTKLFAAILTLIIGYFVATFIFNK